jgi:putative alpha-1,2-mannosidase
VDYEVRAGLSSEYESKGWVASDIHSEAASRTLDYACKFSLPSSETQELRLYQLDDDYAVSVLAEAMNHSRDAEIFRNRANRNAFTLFNSETGFMEARNADGSWAGQDAGWTEGDMWCYSFDVKHNIPGLIERRGGNLNFIKSLEAHFIGGNVLF